MNTDLIINGTKRYFTLTGDGDQDLFLTKDDMSESHWELLMACYHQGQCEDDCNDASEYFEIEDIEKARTYLVECGIDEETFQDTEEEYTSNINESMVVTCYLWVLSGNIQEMQDNA